MTNVLKMWFWLGTLSLVRVFVLHGLMRQLVISLWPGTEGSSAKQQSGPLRFLLRRHVDMGVAPVHGTGVRFHGDDVIA